LEIKEIDLVPSKEESACINSKIFDDIFNIKGNIILGKNIL
jgi:hypothetical protein